MEIKGKLYLLQKIRNNKQQILCIGQVQSGKTRHIIETTINALDNDEVDCVVLLGGTNNTLLSQTKKRIKSETKLKKYKLLNLSDGYNIDNLTLKEKKLFYALKGDVALSKVLKFCSQNKEYRYLLIDDESDYGSLDVSSKENKSSKIYSIIKKIFDEVESCKYLSVTATPFANILSDSWDFDDIYYVKPDDGYCGIKFFNNENLYKIDDNLIYDNGLINKNKFENVIRDHIIRVRKSKLKKSQLLINFDLENSFQMKLKHEITSFMPYMVRLINFNQKEGKDENNKLLQEIMNNIYVLNCDTPNYERKNMFNRHSIIIGGNIVSRGITFEQLITCIMVNEPNELYSADTLLQRCRWFGYRAANKYNDFFDQYKFMKIYITEKIQNCLKECETINEIITNEMCLNTIKQEIKSKNFKYIKPTNKK